MTLNQSLKIISDFGDSSVLMAIAAAAALYFCFCKNYREAIAILAALGLAAGLIAILKLGFMTCGHNVFNIRSPSGHSALSVAVYGIYPLLLIGKLGKTSARVALIFFYALALTIVATRVILGMHTLNEAILGLAIGALSVWSVWFFILKHGPRLSFAPRFNVAILLSLTLVVALVAHGVHFPGERLIGKMAVSARHFLPFCI